MKEYKEYWYRLPITRKLLTCFFIIAFFGAVINLYLHNNNYKVMDQFNYNLTNYYEINELLVTTRNSQAYVEDYLRNHNNDSVDKYVESKKMIYQYIDELEGRFSSVSVHFSINAIKYSVKAFTEKWDASIQSKKEQNELYYLDYYAGLKIYNYTEKYIQELLYGSLSEGAQLYNELVDKSKFTRIITLGMIFATFFLSLFFGGIFSYYLVAPIKKLAGASNQISKGELDIEAVEVKTMDEIGVLGDAFNKMSESIRRLVNDLKQKALLEKSLHEESIKRMKMQQLLQEAEFSALQSQINPHFLFNTLNTISRTAMFEEAPNTIKLIEALSNIFRFSLRNTGKSISLKKELEVLQEYIYLQKFRFKDRLNFQVIYDIPTEDIELPVFSIQPLVENAIIHGIEPKIEGGTVRLKIYQKQEYIVIKIIDSGVGISKEKLKNMLSQDNKKQSKSIGVSNVFNRLQIFYDNKSKLTIQSKEGYGTIIAIMIPNIIRGDENV